MHTDLKTIVHRQSSFVRLGNLRHVKYHYLERVDSTRCTLAMRCASTTNSSLHRSTQGTRVLYIVDWCVSLLATSTSDLSSAIAICQVKHFVGNMCKVMSRESTLTCSNSLSSLMTHRQRVHSIAEDRACLQCTDRCRGT
jgi:hypothetical protein